MDLRDYGFMPNMLPENTKGIPARITAVHKERYALVCEYGETYGRLKTKEYYGGLEEFPTTGDFVLINYLPGSDSQIIRTLPRRTFFIRKDPDPSCCRAGAPANTLASSDAHSNASTDASMQTSPDPIDSFLSSRPKASDTASLSPQDTPTDAWTPVVELDLFAAPFDGLIIAEVEFPSIEAANSFVPPSWFDEDVTSDPAYHNSNLSRHTV